MAHLPHVARRLGHREPIRIVAFGSSSTEGVGATTPAATYPAVLQGVLQTAFGSGSEILVLNRGVGGECASDLLKRIDRDALSLTPDLVIWQTGTNDALQQAPLTRFTQETREALLRLRAADADLMLMEPQWCPVLDRTPGALAYRDAVRDIGAELDIPVVRRWDLMLDWIARQLLTRDQLLAPDELHMTDGGYSLLAQQVAADILSYAGSEARLA